MTNHNVETDVKLCQLVHKEDVYGFTIIACLTRFGGLVVLAHDPDYTVVWQGENILDARNWVAKRSM